ncbi:MAG: Crp/Fnr family transcriptional regulator [Pseudomonadota bacterium]
MLDMFVLGPPNSFGDISLLSGMTPPHMAIVEEDAEIGLIEQKRFQELINADEVIRDWLLWRLSRRLAAAYLALDAIRSQGARERILRYLRWLAANGFGFEDNGNVVEITQAELASRLGLSRATTSATLKALERDGRLICRYGKIEVMAR